MNMNGFRLFNDNKALTFIFFSGEIEEMPLSTKGKRSKAEQAIIDFFNDIDFFQI
jgi:hypothetical protein